MNPYLILLSVPAIGYAAWVCGRTYGWMGYLVFVALLLAGCIVTLVTATEGSADPGIPTQALIGLSGVVLLALACGAFGIAKWRATRQGAAQSDPE